MKREYKFRAWIKDYIDGSFKMYPWDKDFFNDSSPVTNYSGEFPDPNDEDIILMQYTGLKDKNGKEGYEDDIVKLTLENGKTKNMVIIYDAPGYKLKDKFDRLWTGSLVLKNDIEIIGNIHQDKHLLDATT